MDSDFTEAHARAIRMSETPDVPMLVLGLGNVLCGDDGTGAVARILSVNDRAARHNREHCAAAGVLAVNLMGSPGAGKTAVLEATARRLAGRCRLGAIAGDLETDRDADEISARTGAGVAEWISWLKAAGGAWSGVRAPMTTPPTATPPIPAPDLSPLAGLH